MKKFVILVLFVTFISAKDMVLVVGLNHRGVNGENDAKAIVAKLNSLGFKDGYAIYSEIATRDNILKYLKECERNLTKGDKFFLFFSGHGVSLYDNNFLEIAKRDRELMKLMKNSGALIPWDYDDNDAKNSLIIAKRDLAPIFKKLDKRGVKSMVIFDACFSGGSYKDLAVKNIWIDQKKISFGKPSYPYKNLIFVSATTRSDYAFENRKLKRGYLSIAVEKCLRYSDLKKFKTCIYSQKMAQSVVILGRVKKENR